MTKFLPAIPVVAAAGLSRFKDLSPSIVSLLVFLLACLLTLAAVVGKIMRKDPQEKMLDAIFVGLFAGLLSIIVAFATDVGNLWGVFGLALVAALKGPVFIKSKMDDDDTQ